MSNRSVVRSSTHRTRSLSGNQAPSTFSKIPLEILQQIVLNLDPYAYLTVKFICKTFTTATKKSDGAELVTHEVLQRPAMHHYYGPEVRARGSAIARIEADLSTKVRRDRLTRSKCGRYHTKGCHGFCDEEFQQTNGQRLCGGCLSQTKQPQRRNAITVRGKPYFLCSCCWRIHRAETGFTPKDIAAGFNGSYLDIVLKNSKLVKQKSKDRVCGICLKRIAQKAMTQWVKMGSSTEPKGKAKNKKRRREDSENEDDEDEDDNGQNDDDEVDQTNENVAEDDNEGESDDNEDDEDED